jgi:hypothetical protein
VTWTYDPAERDRATAKHRQLENWLIGRVEAEGLVPLDPDGSVEYDLAWAERDGSLSVCEVKTTSGHEDRQLRLGVGQILQYTAHLSRDWAAPVTPVVLVEEEPSDPAWPDICRDHGIVLTWPGRWRAARENWLSYDTHPGRDTNGPAARGPDPQDPQSE